MSLLRFQKRNLLKNGLVPILPNLNQAPNSDVKTTSFNITSKANQLSSIGLTLDFAISLTTRIKPWKLLPMLTETRPLAKHLLKESSVRMTLEKSCSLSTIYVITKARVTDVQI
jgi:hypothetical protein